MCRVRRELTDRERLNMGKRQVEAQCWVGRRNKESLDPVGELEPWDAS